MSLIGDLDGLTFLAQRDAGGVLLGADGAGLGLVFDEGDALAAGHQADFLEALEAAEEGGEAVDVVLVRQVAHEEDLVGRQILVRHDGGAGRVGGFEAGAARGFGGLPGGAGIADPAVGGSGAF